MDTTEPQAPRIALIAHDRKKDTIVALAREFTPVLRQCALCATGTTGGRIAAETGLAVERMLSGPFGGDLEVSFDRAVDALDAGLEVERMLSGPMGGDLQIGARLAGGELDLVIFLRDPMTPQPHEPDINALVRACDVHDVPCATNEASARMLMSLIATRPGQRVD